MPAPVIDNERFETIRQKFATLGRELTDAQLLTLADTYHEILRLRRTRRNWRERVEAIAHAPH